MSERTLVKHWLHLTQERGALDPLYAADWRIDLLTQEEKDSWDQRIKREGLKGKDWLVKLGRESMAGYAAVIMLGRGLDEEKANRNREDAKKIFERHGVAYNEENVERVIAAVVAGLK